MSDDTTTGTVGDDAAQVAQGKRNQQQTMRAGDVHVGASGDFPVWKLVEMSSDIRSLIAQRLPERVDRLERLEVVVRPGLPPEVIVRPLPNDTVHLSVWMIAVIIIVVMAIALGMAAFLIYSQVANV